jgi:SAM-dependent methyltransferase
VLGIDLSVRMLEVARRLADDEGLENTTFVHGDAQVHPFEPGSFDVATSRFGAMFFADATAAFANIGAALARGGRLVLLAWSGLDRNEWLRCVLGALAVGRELPVPPPGAPGPFALADPERNRAVLTDAGFAGVEVAFVDEPLWAGVDGDDAYLFFAGAGVTRGMTQDLDEADRRTALERLRQSMFEHDTGDGVWFGSGTCVVTATWEPRR